MRLLLATSRGCATWVIGNEPNLATERPGGLEILPLMYADCYRRCRNAIHRRAGHESDQVVVAAIGPWNIETKYPGNPGGDWVKYFQDVLAALQNEIDGIAIHTYGRSSDPGAVDRDVWNHGHRWTFTAYKDWMEAIPAWAQGLPVYLTEMNQGGEWDNLNTGWVRAAYAEINAWNQAHAQPIRCACLYRWNRDDHWSICDKNQVQYDLVAAMEAGYKWRKTMPSIIKEPPIQVDGRCMTITEFREHVGGLFWNPKPNLIVLHHTAVPTVEQWQGARSIQAMKGVYESKHWTDDQGREHEGWSAGPHLFIAEDGVWLFTPLTQDGIHVVGHNSRSIGIEMVGNYDIGELTDVILESTVAALAILCQALGLSPQGIAFHRDLDITNCPGRYVDKDRIIGLVETEMGATYPVQRSHYETAIAARWLSEEATRCLERNDTASAISRLKEQTKLLYDLEGFTRGFMR